MKKSALILLTGIALGVAAGLLLAPEEGSRTRKKWLKKGKKYEKAFKQKLSEYTDGAANMKENLEGAAKDVKNRFS